MVVISKPYLALLGQPFKIKRDFAEIAVFTREKQKLSKAKYVGINSRNVYVFRSFIIHT